MQETKWMEDINKTRPHKIKIIKGHMNSQRLTQHAQGQHRSTSGPLHIYNGFQFSVFVGFFDVQMNGPLFPVPSLVFFSFFCFVQF